MKISSLRSPFAVSLILGIAVVSSLILALASSAQTRPDKPAAVKSKAAAKRARAKRTPPSVSRPTLAPSVTAQRPSATSAAIRPPERPEAYDSPAEAAEFFRLKRLPEGATELPIEKYFEAQEQMRLMPQYSTAENRMLPARAAMNKQDLESLPAWTPLGPNNVGGRTRALLIHPTNPSVMYAAGVSGGVWKTTNGGALWTPLADLMANLAVSALAMDPKNPNVIYAGTGEGYFNIDGIRGAGIFKTTDGGATWTRLPSTSGEDFYYVNDIVISPSNSQRLYAATGTGVFRSLDGGTTWTRILNPTQSSSSTTTVTGGCLDLAIRTDKTSDYLFAACGTIIDQATVYRNTNAATSSAWTPVLSESGMGRTSLAIAPSDQSIIYAAAASIAEGDFQDGLHAVFRSTSSGDAGTWTGQVRNANLTKLNTVLFSNPLAAFQSECGMGTDDFFANQGWYDNAIAVDPTNPNIVFVGGIDLFRSDDGGVNWGLASHWWADKSAPQYAHADHHALVFHPQYNGASNQTLFVATDGGIFRTDNARAATAIGVTGPCNPANSAVAWTPLNNGYAVTQFYHGLPYPDGASYFGGTQDNGTLRGTDAGGASGWKEILGGDGGIVAIDTTNPNVLYASTPGRRIRKSLDGGATFSLAVNGIDDEYALFINPFVMDPSNPQRLWTGGAYIWSSRNGAGSWERGIYTPGRGIVSAITVAPTNANRVLVGMTAGEIVRTNMGLTSNNSADWPYAYAGSGYVSSVAFDPTNANIAYATYSTFGGAHVFRSTDGGANWMAIDGVGANKLPDIPVNCIVVDPANPVRLYIGTDLGVFVSTDSGQNWAVENTGFANVVTESLSLNVVNGATSLYAFTHGRGAWRVPVGNDGCRYVLSATGQRFEDSGGNGNVSVTATPSGCAWKASSLANWITINSGGDGSGIVNFTVSANNSLNPRTGLLTIAGQTFVVEQSGIKCVYSVTFSNQSFGGNGGTGSASVTAANGCSWQASSDSGWLTINSGNNGNGNGVVNFTVAANTSNTPRTASLSIAGQTYRLSQAGNTSGCTYSISSGSQTFTSDRGTGSVNVTAGSGCNWQAIVANDQSDWIKINSGGSGSGNGTVAFSVSAYNYRYPPQGNPPRTGTLIIAGQTFTVTQAGRDCRPMPISAGQTVNGRREPGDCRYDDSDGTYWYFDLYSFTNSSGQRFIPIMSAPQTTYLTVYGLDGAPVDGNSILSNGTYIIVVSPSYRYPTGDYTLSLLAATANCNYTLSPGSLNIGPSGMTGSVKVTAPSRCEWQSGSHASWITINSGSGKGDGTVSFTVAPNTGLEGRGGGLFIADRSFSVTQSGDHSRCSATPIKPGQIVSGTVNRNDCYIGGSYTADRFSFTATAGQIVDITLKEAPFYGGVTLLGPDGTVISSNYRSTSLSAKLPADGNYVIEVYYDGTFDYTFTLGLASAGCDFQLSPDSQYFAANGGIGVVNLTAKQSSCAWHALSGASWIKVNSANAGSGSALVSYSIEPNTGSLREGTLHIAGRTLTVRQVGQSCPQPLGFGQTMNSMPGNCSSYSFNASAGQQISVYVSTQNSYFSIRLIAPSGRQITQVYSRSRDNYLRFPQEGFFVLPESGLHFIEVRAESTSGTGPYSLTLTDGGAQGCNYVLAQSSQIIMAPDGSGNVMVMTGNSCNWRVVSGANWITVNPGNDVNNGTRVASFTVAANTSNRPRTGTLTVAGQNVSLFQYGDGSSCTVTPISFGQTINGSWSTSDCLSPINSYTSYSIYADRYSFSGAAGQAVTISLSSVDDISTGRQLALISPSGTVVAEDSGYSGGSIPRSGFFSLPASGTYIIEVAASKLDNYTLRLNTSPSCTYSLASNSQFFSASMGNGSVNVTSGNDCNWAATSNATWITITAFAGKGNGVVNYAVAPNFTSNARTGTLTIAGQTFTVTQAGRPCTAAPISAGQTINGSLSANDCGSLVLESLAYVSDRYTFTGAAGQLVALSLNSAAFDPYLYLIGPDGAVLAEDDDGGDGLNARIPAGSGFFRLPASGVYTIEVTSFEALSAGDYTLRLSVTTCNYAVALLNLPGGARYEATGGNGSVTVSCADGCEWSAASQVSWITLTAGASGTGGGSVTFNVAPNTSAQGRSGTLSVAGQTVTITQTAAVASVSAASFGGAELASESIVAAFGAGLATATQVATTVPLPTTLAGTTVKVRDSTGVTRDAPLFFVAPTQVNYLIPPGTAVGAATVIVTSNGNVVATGIVQIAMVAPGLFSANASGAGLAAATVLRVKADGSQSYEPVTRFDSAQGKIIAVPIDLGPETDQVFLLVFGTGFHKPSALSAVSCKIGGTNTEVLYAGPQPDFVGLDQSNVRIPRGLKGRGEVDVTLTIDGKSANTVKVNIK